MQAQVKVVAGIAAALGLSLAGYTAMPLVKHYEGEVLQVYKDPIGLLTACSGHTGAELRLGITFTKEQCQELLKADLRVAEKGVDRCLKVPVDYRTKAALISFTLNTGAGNFCSSTLVKLANAGKIKEACEQLPRWVYAKKRKLPGLVTRREAEKSLCLLGVSGA